MCSPCGTSGSPEKRYGDRVAAWWRRAFPKANVRFVNAGIGATGSDYGALRAKRDLLSHHPDFIIVEYAVNDSNTQAAAETLEGLVRQILRETNQPAVLLLFTMHQDGGNAQEWQAKVGRHRPRVQGLGARCCRNLAVPDPVVAARGERARGDRAVAPGDPGCPSL